MARVRCQDQKDSGFGHTSKHPGQGCWWLKPHSWKWAGPPTLPQMGPNSVLSFQSPSSDWRKVLAICHPMPMRAGPTTEDLGYQGNSNCWQHQVLGLGSSMKGFPPSPSWACWDWVYSWIPLGLDPFPGTPTPTLASPGSRVCMYHDPYHTWGDLPKSWALHLQHESPRMSCCHLQPQDLKVTQAGITLGCLLNKWINKLHTGHNSGPGQPPI